jgi:hypothetical protein
MKAQVGGTYATREADTGRLLFTCPGPTGSGACGRVALGENVACAGNLLTCVDACSDVYSVPRQLSLCPITLLQSLAVETDSSLIVSG